MTTATMEFEVETSDAVLVAQVLGGDRAAFATVYDRYASQLFNFARSMLRSNEDASDAVADAFLKCAERLPQLREPAKLRAWLYAIVRTECLHRLKLRKRVVLGGDDHLADLPDSGVAPDEAVETAALRQLVWDAAAGLGERDRTILDLHLRQGLEGADLGEAMGVSVAHAYVLVDRLRKQMERSLGALLVAKSGRKNCADLDSSLTTWDGSYSPLVRKRVARHVDNCVKCTARRAAMVSPLALFAGVPAFAAPMGLRDRVLNSVTLTPAAMSPSSWLRHSVLGCLGAAVLVVLSTVHASHTGEGQLPPPPAEVAGDALPVAVPPVVDEPETPPSVTASIGSMASVGAGVPRQAHDDGSGDADDPDGSAGKGKPKLVVPDEFKAGKPSDDSSPAPEPDATSFSAKLSEPKREPGETDSQADTRADTDTESDDDSAACSDDC